MLSLTLITLGPTWLQLIIMNKMLITELTQSIMIQTESTMTMSVKQIILPPSQVIMTQKMTSTIIIPQHCHIDNLSEFCNHVEIHTLQNCKLSFLHFNSYHIRDSFLINFITSVTLRQQEVKMYYFIDHIRKKPVDTLRDIALRNIRRFVKEQALIASRFRGIKLKRHYKNIFSG